MLRMLSQLIEGQDRQTTLPLPVRPHCLLAMSTMGGMGGRAKARVARMVRVKRDFILGWCVETACK